LIDVGGGDGSKGDLLRKRYAGSIRAYDCIDVAEAPKCTAFSGTTLAPRPDEDVDVVLMSYMLHHAAENTISLLQEAPRVARHWVVVLEDMLGDSESTTFREYNHNGCARVAADGTEIKHQCVYRTHVEWQALFGLTGLRMVRNETGSERLRNCMPMYAVPRGFYLLEPVRRNQPPSSG
jgi:SAM-dependent methyltransferase